jgi:Fur family ferric uptake transcriptional regulator
MPKLGGGMPLPGGEPSVGLRATLLSRGVRMTRQRAVILDIIETASQHLDAAQILRKAVRVDPRINRVTVYRTLGLLKRQGLVDELDLLHVKGEGHYYERRPQRDHIHVTCLRCGGVQKFESELFDRVKGQVQRDCNFHISVSRFEVGGYCESCQSSGLSSSSRNDGP